MPIVEKKTAEGSTYLYQQPEIDTIYQWFLNIAKTLKIYIESIPELDFASDVVLNKTLIGEAAVRIDKRREYFVIFHDETEINEVKEAALWAYWIIKFRPIGIKQEKLSQLSGELQAQLEHINESFAVFLIYSAVMRETARCNVRFSINKEYTKKISYAFRYWHLNKSALMMIAESLCASMQFEKKDESV